MSIPASQIVQVNPRLLQPGGTDLEFNGLLLSASPLIPASQLVLPFPDAASVGDYFGLESPEYQAAQVYFLGYTNSFKKPRALYVASRVAEARSAWLRSGPWTGTLEQLQTAGTGGLSLTVNGQSVTAHNLSFADATSYSDVAQKLQTALTEGLPGLTVTWSSLTKAWEITSPTSGADSTITYAQAPETGVDFAGLLKLTEATGAVLSPGMDALSAGANMEAILDLTENFVCFTTVAQPTEADALALAQWASGKGVAYLYIYWDNDPRLLQPNNTATIAAALAEANVGATCGVWNSLAYAAMIMGTAASIDWERRNGAITFAFKSQDGLAANVVTGTDAINLEAQNMNFMGDYATRNDQFIFLYPGRMFGTWIWIDTYLNAVWLNNALQVACMAGFEQTPRVPYNEEGYTLIRAWMQDPVNRALNAGIIDTGVTLSAAQKAELTREAGRDISGELFTDGYVIQVNDPAPAVRQKRESPEASCWYCYGGSVHRLTIASTAVV